jgi:hypothetical protein
MAWPQRQSELCRRDAASQGEREREREREKGIRAEERDGDEKRQ